MGLQVLFISSLEKVMYGSEPAPLTYPVSGFQNETLSFQAAFRLTDMNQGRVLVEAESALGEHVKVRHVRHMPVRMATYADADEHYLGRSPGLYPDLLKPIGNTPLWAYADRWETLWIDVEPDEMTAPGCYDMTLRFTAENGAELAVCTQQVRILPGLLPKQTLRRTEWFHCDCLAEVYRVPVFSEEHWQIIERFAACAVRRGINTLLMPVHTPPLDTRIGGERLTTQLVKISLEEGTYRFDMTNVRRWIAMCRRIGVQGYEVAHLFTQWGAKHAPKIVAEVDGCEQRIFGWDTDATSPAYCDFLAAYIPALQAVFRETGIEQDVIWHISDEPHEATLESYMAAKEQVADLLKGSIVMDALSHIDFYQQGIVCHPIAATSHIEPFLEAGVPELWAYYCCAQYRQVANRFIAMPSSRTRVLGVQLYLYRIAGFLQWGFNFYHSQYSDYVIDPYATTDADGWVPAGDPFSVYPGADGMPEESIRTMVCAEAMQDLRALYLLESLTSREEVCALIRETAGCEITFAQYPADSSFVLSLRDRVNQRILETAAGKQP